MFFYLFFSFLFGLAIGSFLNCLIYRLACPPKFFSEKFGRAEKKSINGRSFCPKCHHQLAWYDNIPLISFIMLRGKCRYCGKPISWQYPVVELATGLLFVVAFLRLNVSCSMFHVPCFMLLVRNWIILSALVFTFVYDIKYLEIEDAVLLPAAGAVLILNLIIGCSLSGIIIAMALGVGFFGLQYLVTKGNGIGLGDTRIGLLMGAGLANWPALLVAIFFAYLIGGSISLFLLAQKRKNMKSRIPLGPFLAAGMAIALFWGQQIINWYLSF